MQNTSKDHGSIIQKYLAVRKRLDEYNLGFYPLDNHPSGSIAIRVTDTITNIAYLNTVEEVEQWVSGYKYALSLTK